MTALIEGYAAGLALIVLVGPVLFVLLQTTLDRGRAHGLAVALGIFVSDVVAVAICLATTAALFERPDVQLWLGLGGGALLVAFGLRYLVGPVRTQSGAMQISLTSLAGDFARGFLVNFVNPFVFLVWLSLIGAATLRHGDHRDLFLAGTLLGILTLDVGKALLAHRIRPHLRPDRLRRFYRIAGVALVAFGVRLWVLVA